MRKFTKSLLTVALLVLAVGVANAEKKYADLARHFLEVRGNSSNFLEENLREQGKNRIFPEFADYDALYAQSHLPATEQTTAEGHAVRAMYMFSAMNSWSTLLSLVTVGS